MGHECPIVCLYVTHEDAYCWQTKPNKNASCHTVHNSNLYIKTSNTDSHFYQNQAESLSVNSIVPLTLFSDDSLVTNYVNTCFYNTDRSILYLWQWIIPCNVKSHDNYRAVLSNPVIKAYPSVLKKKRWEINTHCMVISSLVHFRIDIVAEVSKDARCHMWNSDLYSTTPNIDSH